MAKAATKQPAHFENTPASSRAREVLERIGDKWSVCVIHSLGEAKTLRFNALRARLTGISQRMLTVTLRGLERDGLVARRVYPEVPPRVEYSLTPLGATLRQLIGGLVSWSAEHLADVEAARCQYDKQYAKSQKASTSNRRSTSVQRRKP
jgi:DNA-binding HxlR family transcriptional regulator